MSFHFPIEDRFPTSVSTPPPTREQREASVQIQRDIVIAATTIDARVPDGRWKSLALTALEEALMWANKGVFNEKQ